MGPGFDVITIFGWQACQTALYRPSAPAQVSARAKHAVARGAHMLLHTCYFVAQCIAERRGADVV